MAVIFSYPIKSTPDNDDLILISDGTDNLTKQVRVSTLPGGSTSGVASLNTLTQAVTITGGTNVTLNTVGNNIEINSAGGGDTYTLQAETKSNNSVPLKLDAATGTDSTVNLTEGSNVTLTRNSANEITIAATGGNAGVSSFTNANGTYISAGTANSAATGAVTIGTIDLSAVDGTSDTTTRFLSKDNTWDVPSYTNSLSVENSGSAVASGITTLDFSTNLNAVSAGPGSNKISITSTNTTYHVMGANGNYSAGLVLTGNATHGNQFLRKDGTWQAVSAAPSNPTNSVQFNNNGAFGGSANLTYSSDTLTVKDNVVIRGDGSANAGKLRLECFDNANTHYIDLIGPDHGGGAASYSVKFPATGPGANNKILESNSSGALSWIDTPTGGLTQTSGVWYATLANSSGQSYASTATQTQITITTNNCQWLRIGNMIHYQFYLAGTLKGTASGAAGILQGPLFLCQTGTGGGLSATTYGLPINTTLGNTLVDDGFCNGSLVMTETEAPQQALTWAYPVNGGRIGRDTNYVGYVELCSLLPATNKLYYPNSAVVWITNNNETAGNWALAGTLSAMVSHA